MCGIVASCRCPSAGETTTENGDGSVNHGIETSPQQLSQHLQHGLDAIKHRGPDGSGTWVSQDGSIGLGHCRLSINDLSPLGAQPIHNADSIHAVVNGEIYDFDRLRDICASEHGYRFTGHSDSELVVALYQIHGAPGLFEHLRGEFAFVLVDQRPGSQRVIAVRDRFGIKPLVWTTVGDRVVLAAEAKALKPLGWQPEWDVQSITDSGWLVDERTVFKNVQSVKPGHWMEITDGRGIQMHQYWDADFPDKTIVETRTIEEMVQGVRERLINAVRLRMRADVPIGVYLSGGIDSSAIAGIVTHLARTENVKIGSDKATQVACFSVQFPEASGYDESDIADRTANWLGIEIHRHNADEQRLADDFVDAAYHNEQHHMDLNSVAKFALSSLPQQQGLKVVLTGEGSDEHFGGYAFLTHQYLYEPDLAMPNILADDTKLRVSLETLAINKRHEMTANDGSRTYNGFDDGVLEPVNGSTMPATIQAWDPVSTLYSPWVQRQAQGYDTRKTVLASILPDVLPKIKDQWHHLHAGLYMWQKSVLANTLLTCEGDRAEMSHSIEARTPFLDHSLTEYVNSLPPSTKLRYTPPNKDDGDDEDGTASAPRRAIVEKWILREAVRPFVTDEVYRRRKVPFSAPTRWPKDGPLHCMFKRLLTREAVEELGFVDYAVVEAALESAFGETPDQVAFRTLNYTGGWVAIGQRLGVKKATVEESNWSWV
ncbi:asparagine synthase domain-containing protein [Hirsutella rhossiliensis]